MRDDIVRKCIRVAGKRLVPRWRERPPRAIPEDVLVGMDEQRLMLIHIPKTAGTSLSKYLYGAETKHRPAIDLAVLYPVRFARMRKFAVVREPIDRFLSAYDYLKQGGKNAQDAEFGRKFVAPHANVGDFIDAWRNDDFRRAASAYPHFRPQAYYVTASGRLLVNQLARFDHLSEDLRNILGEDAALPKHNVTKGERTGPDELSRGNREFLKKYYAFDFRLWSAARETRDNCFGRRL